MEKKASQERQGKTIALLFGIFIGVFLMTNLVNATLCYQEFTNETTVCGGLSGGYYFGTDATALQIASDGDYATMTHAQQDFYAVYQKPVDVVGVTWKIGIEFSTDYYGLPATCFQQNFVTVFIHNILAPFPTQTYSFNCLEGDNVTWNVFASGWASGTIGIRDEAMIWEINHTTTEFIENNWAYRNSTIGGLSENFALNISYDTFNWNIVSGDLIYAGTDYIGTITGAGDEILLSKNLIIPLTNTTVTNNFYWRIGLQNSSGAIFYFNSTTKSQTVSNLLFDDCSSYSTMIYNITFYNQDDRTIITPSNVTTTLIETTSTLSSGGTIIYNQSIFWTDTNPVHFCVNNNLVNLSYRLDGIIGYRATGYVQQYYYIQNANLTTGYNPTISLYGLPTTESTSFLVTYQDENYLYIPNAVIQVWRKYVGLGDFFLVETGKTDANGQTILHLITEDVVYKFLVFRNGVLDYESPEYLALCQATPCQINLKKPYQVQTGLSPFENIYYSLDFNSTLRKITFTFATINGASTNINMTVMKSSGETSGEQNVTVCSETKITSGGTIVCNIPVEYEDTTYLVQVYKEGKFLGYKTFSLAVQPQQIFGTTGILLTAIAFLLLALMGISSGIATIVLGIIGLVFASLLAIFNSGNILGIGSAMIWIIVAGIIIIVKINQRRAS